jgi:large repetitive protein
VWTVPASGALDIPVLPDWRDKADGDPVSLVSADVVGAAGTGASARTTAGGLVRFLAPPTGGTFTVAYFVTDGMGDEVRNELKFRVQDRSDRKAVPATAEPDIVAGEVGRAITIRPLGNDLPGSDPVTPDAELALAGRVAEPGGATVKTDLVDGTLTFVADKPRTYFLAYDAAYGDAPFATGRIRVDVRASRPGAPVAMPDNVTLYGQASSLVDVLANDVDPAGGMIVVQRAAPLTDNQLDVAVVDGRWLRISARQGQLDPNPQIVRYTITNGTRSGIEGEVVVSQQPAPADNTPVTEPDRITVRAGAAVSIPVLDNDFSPSGDALSLVSHVTGVTAGQLEVQVQGDQKVPTGQAFVAGRFVRYVAPADLGSAQTFTVPYLATNADGERAPGRAEITVLPLTRRNQPPEPPVLEGRVVAGDTIALKLPGAQVDPDGDAVTVLGISAAPQLGRVVTYGANSIEYQAYPGSAGTDEFTYQITDSAGAVATGSVRVGVVPPGAPQPPLAVADAITVEPGRTARVDVLANDLVAAGDRVRIRLIDPPAGVRLQSGTGPVIVPAPGEVDGRNVEVVYAIDNGVDSSQTTLTLRTAVPYNNPPVVFDAFGSPDAGDGADGGADGGVDDRVTVDVLATAYDPDGPSGELKITDVFAPEGVQATSDGATISVQRGPDPVVVPFRVEDADGGAATASLFVPAAGSGPPYVKADGLIRLEPGSTKTLKLSDYVINPSGAPLMLTYRNRIWPSPQASLNAAVTGEQTLEVSADDRYVGPGAVAFEVTTGTSVDDPNGVRSVLSVPVQVGDPVPILRCPSDIVEVSQAESVDLDIAAVCHVWTADPADADKLRFDADWTTSVPGLSIIEPSGPVIEVAAAGDAKPGAEARLKMTSGDSEPGELRIRVVKSPPPSLAPIRIADMRAGESRTVDLTKYLTAGVSDPHPTVVRVSQMSDLDVRAARSGDSAVTITTGARVDGTAQFDVVMSDVAGSSSPERQVKGRITLEILDVPDTPKAPVPGLTVRSQEVHLDWAPPQANGAPIQYYEVRASDGSVNRCASSSCDVAGLVNGRKYTFKVRAHNAVGDSPWSPPSRPATPDMLPGEVGPIEATRIGDRTITIRWTKPTTQTSAVKWYWVTWQGGSRRTTTTSATLQGLDNNRRNVFTVQAVNDLGSGAKRVSESFQTVGNPGTPATPAITDQQTAGDQGTVSLSWPAVDPNGPTPVTYTVFRNNAPLPRCADITSTTCDDSGITYDGTRYSYKVRSTNGGGKSSGFSGTASWDAVGQPAEWGDWTLAPTGADNEARASFTVPGSRGARSTVNIYADGAVVKQFDGTGAQTQNLSVADNDGPHDVYLQVCNEKGSCSDSSHKSVQTYGPLVAGHIISITPQSSGTSVNWVVTVDTNGDPATVNIRSSRRNVNLSATGVDRVTVSSGYVDLGYSSTETVTVTLSDSTPNRGSVSRTASYRTPDRPPPTVALSRGALCNDGNSLPDCNTGGGGIDCTHPSCGHIHLSSSNVPAGTMSCTIHSEEDPSGWGSGNFAANSSYDTPRYYGYGGDWIYVHCTAGGKSFDSDHNYHWPTGN